MTDGELLALKKLAQKAEPFTGDLEMLKASISEEERLRRAGHNAAFVVAAHAAMPELIDEVLNLRRTLTLRGWTHGKWV